MKMFIPNLGFEFTLSKSWKFNLFFESRNTLMLKLYDWEQVNHLRYKNVNTNKIISYFYKDDPSNPNYKYNPNVVYCSDYGKMFVLASLPKDTKIKVDRIYIRKGSKDYDSVTFYAQFPKQKKKYRFWAKLDDVNKIEFKK
jgi:hypothetical protein